MRCWLGGKPLRPHARWPGASIPWWLLEGTFRGEVMRRVAAALDPSPVPVLRRASIGRQKRYYTIFQTTGAPSAELREGADHRQQHQPPSPHRSSINLRLRPRTRESQGHSGKSEIVRRQSSMLGDPSEHARADFFAVMEGEDIFRPSVSRQGTVRASLPFNSPADADERSQNARCFCGRPIAHAAKT